MENKENKRWLANLDKDAVVFAIVVIGLGGLAILGNAQGIVEKMQVKEPAKKVNVVDMITKKDTVDVQQKNVMDLFRVWQR